VCAADGCIAAVALSSIRTPCPVAASLLPAAAVKAAGGGSGSGGGGRGAAPQVGTRVEWAMAKWTTWAVGGTGGRQAGGAKPSDSVAAGGSRPSL